MECKSKYTTKARFKDHMYTHSGFVFPCEKCHLILRTPYSSNNHRNNQCIGGGNDDVGKRNKREAKAVPAKSSITVIVCQLCDEAFTNVDSFEKHVDGHTVHIHRMSLYSLKDY